jgi:outer membrane receptor protein involved in Fe transport
MPVAIGVVDACADDLPDATLPAVVIRAEKASVGGAPVVGARNRITVKPAALPSAATTITAGDIAATNMGRDISNVFRRVPGVLANNIDQGETGNGFRMRGFATQGTHGADTAIYVDGVPQNIPSSQGGAGHGPVFLEWLTSDMIGSIDVVKGPVSALFGDQNRAGAVDMVTKRGGSFTPSSVAVTAERYGLKRASLVLSNQLQEVESLVVAEIYRNDGYRYASRTDRDNIFWKLSTRQGDGLYSLRASYYKANFQAAGHLLLPQLQQGLDPRSTQFNNPGFGNAERRSLVFNRAPADGEAGWYATAYAETLERTRAIATSATQHTVGHDDRSIVGARLAQNFVYGDRAALMVGAELRRDRGDALRQIYVNRVPTASYVNNQDLDLLTYGLFAQAQYRPVQPLKLLGGLRYDRFDYDIVNRKLPAASTGYRHGVATPKFGAVWTVTPQFDVFANVAQGFRSPAAEQISSSGSTGPLGASGGVISPVSPTKVRSYDLGFTTTPAAGWSVSGAVYYTLNQDEIVLQPDGSYKSVGDTTRKGFELETRYRIGRAASVYASYGRIAEAKVNNPAANTGAKLSVPKHQLKAGADYKTRLGSGQLTLNADGYVISDIPYYVGTPQVLERNMPVYTRYDLRATYDWQDVQVSFYAVLQPHRFGSEIAYGSSAGLLISPVPRRTFGATVRYFF